ncbi:hypothetical protein NDU88_003111 [Pleurodeles waltl]|uniref:Uncharacterized protein n=1 Tax=Pleurodeles waltl TaxID=8319 RepID=A0AAV7T4D7_PLEWA|nr:hypothetical protein NDU88_003111 [Pleurodeles waltl]
MRLIRLSSHALKTNMAPKATRNPGDKTDGVKMTRVGRDKGEPAEVNKRLTSIAGKAVGKNTLGLVKDSKMSDSTNWKSRGKAKANLLLRLFSQAGQKIASLYI